MILMLIVLLTLMSLSLRVTIMGLEVTNFVINRADDIRRVGQFGTVQATRVIGKKTHRVAATASFVTNRVADVSLLGIKMAKNVAVLGLKSSIKLLRFIVARLRDLLLSLESFVIVLDIVIFLVLSAAAAGYMVLYCTTDESGNLVYNEEVLASLGVSTSGTGEEQELGEDGVSNGTFTSYSLSEEEILKIARLCQQEQGTVEGAAAEASLMCNRYELYGGSYSSVYDYARNSGWFARASHHMDNGDASDEIVSVVRNVINHGFRVLPAYVDEHDCFSDIASATNNGTAITVSNREDYEQFVTKIDNVYGASYTFYCFPASNSDPFGYTSEDSRAELGDGCYSIEEAIAGTSTSNRG